MSITPDKEDIYITINITEGPRYTVSDVRLAGELLMPGAELDAARSRCAPATSTRARGCRRATKAISDRLGTEGYAFANVNAVPEIDREKLQAAFTFFIDPGRRVYMRRINISGNVQDARRGDPPRDAPARGRLVRRRAHRALEGAHHGGSATSTTSTSRRRRSPGSPDQVDIEVTVTEKPTGNLLAGVGYSSADGSCSRARSRSRTSSAPATR